MIKTTDQLTKASPKTRRTVRYEYELEHEALDCVFDSNNAQDFRFQVRARVLEDHRFDQLPSYRQVAIDAYIRGALDYAARSKGVDISQVPDAVRPQPRKPRVAARARPAAVPSLGFLSGATLPRVWNGGIGTGFLAAAAYKPAAPR